MKKQSEDLRKKRSERSLGSCNSNSKLTEIEVIAILEKYDEKESLPDVGKISGNNRALTYSHIFSMIYAKKYNVNILVNNAGFALPNSFEKTPMEDEERFLRVLSTSVISLTKWKQKILKVKPVCPKCRQDGRSWRQDGAKMAPR